MTIFDQIRQAAKAVVQKADHVSISDKAIERLPVSLPERQDFSADPARRFRGDTAGTVDFVLMLECVNFGSGWRDDLRAEGSLPKDRRFYTTIMNALEKYTSTNGIPDALELKDMDVASLSDVFGLCPDKPGARQLLGWFQKSLAQYADYLLQHYNGSGYELFKKSGALADRLVSELARIESFQDVAEYKGLRVPFYKRAQIAAADLHYALESQGRVFEDIDELTAFADPALPQILHAFGVLEYSPHLQNLIKSKTELRPGSPEEVEIRAATIEAVDRLHTATPSMRVMDIDFALWTMAGGKDLKHHPRHITKTLNY